MTRNLTKGITIWIIGLVVCLIILAFWILGGTPVIFPTAAFIFFLVSLLILAWLVWSGLKEFYDSYK